MRLLIFILLPFSSFSQTFLGMEATTKGVGWVMGYKAKQAEVTFNYRLPMIKATVPNTSSLLVGYSLNEHISASAGIGYYRVESFADYNELNNYKITKITEWHPSFRIEAGTRLNDGRLFIAANFCKISWASFGFKTYL